MLTISFKSAGSFNVTNLAILLQLSLQDRYYQIYVGGSSRLGEIRSAALSMFPQSSTQSASLTPQVSKLS
ncbi:hypothetical protein PGT21_025074 [Puccinia graminis f. sp. tritici]|uniref:Uncharacterized protein n=1 Tax=Puccinia graminis f. sp. tritici TaxID=56615 RepID=A0A5B0P7V6_PUCGR|nr:hypothetical protein PGT21_025074 [Puccinia graminis f. sp. tritici]KAA1131734.1 hypothetical protein PGTUg99_018333 [Puccinia graminis f. sp. tritici]